MERAPIQEFSAAYLRGDRDSVVQLVDRLLADGCVAVARFAPAALRAVDELDATWGLHATRVLSSQFTGKGIKVAVLDTGFGPHPDFANRNFLTGCRGYRRISALSGGDGRGPAHVSTQAS